MQLTFAQCSTPVSFTYTWKVSQPGTSAGPIIGAWGGSTGVIHYMHVYIMHTKNMLHHTKTRVHVILYILSHNMSLLYHCISNINNIRLYILIRQRSGGYLYTSAMVFCVLRICIKQTYIHYMQVHSHLQNVGCANVLWSRQSWQPSLVMSLVKCSWWVTELLSCANVHSKSTHTKVACADRGTIVT